MSVLEQATTNPSPAKTATVWVDSEVHLFPPEWCEPRYQPPATEHVMRRMIFEHPEREQALSRATAEGLLNEMGRTGIDRAVVMGLPWQEPELCWRNNAYIAQAMRRSPDQLIGVGVLPPPSRGSVRDGVRRVADEGLRGVKVIPSWQGYRLHDPVFAPALEEMQARGLVLVPHTDHAYLAPDTSDTPHGLFEVARRYPGLRILAPHLGGMLCLYALHPPVRSVLANILFITTVPSTMIMVRFAVEAVGADRVAFGTDFPFNPSHDQATLRQAFAQLALAPESARRIAGANALRFFGLAA